MRGSDDRRKAGLERMDAVLGDVLEDAGVAKQVERLQALDLWADVVGDQVARVTAARSVDEGALIVEVKSSAWLMELNMMKSDIVQRMNERMREVPIERIVFVLAETG